MDIKLIETSGARAAILALRYPMDSFHKSDSQRYTDPVIWGERDLLLAKKLVLAGDEHAKFTRYIKVWAEMILPLNVWNQMDTYKVGTVRTSASTMHRLGSSLLEYRDFQDSDVSTDTLLELNEIILKKPLDKEKIRNRLPWSYLQASVFEMNYQVARHIYLQRKNHKLPIWQKICRWIEDLPNAEHLITPIK